MDLAIRLTRSTYNAFNNNFVVGFLTILCSTLWPSSTLMHLWFQALSRLRIPQVSSLDSIFPSRFCRTHYSSSKNDLAYVYQEIRHSNDPKKSPSMPVPPCSVSPWTFSSFVVLSVFLRAFVDIFVLGQGQCRHLREFQSNETVGVVFECLVFEVSWEYARRMRSLENVWELTRRLRSCEADDKKSRRLSVQCI